MKTTKLIMAVLAAFLFSNLVFALKPLTGDVGEFAQMKIKQLNKMIAITDSQKVIIEKKAREFGMKILNKDSITYEVFSPQYKQEYKVAIDSILTNDQKALLAQKQLDKKNARKASIKGQKIK